MKKPEANILLNYLEKAMEMESSIYGQRLLASAYPDAVRTFNFKEPQKPKKTDRSDLDEPEKPRSNSDIIVLLFWIALSALCALCSIAMLISADFMMTIGSLLFCSLFLICARKRLKKNMAKKKEYSEGIELIQNIKMLDEELYQKKMEKYNEDFKRYEERKKEFEHDCREMEERLATALKATEEALEKFYSVGIVRKEYQNLVAICSLYGYIDQRRAAYLEGMYGAYDIYDEEMRQTIITDNIPNDEDGMLKLKENQFELYQVLRNKKGQVERLIMNISGKANYCAFIDECNDLNEDIISLVEMGAWDEPCYPLCDSETETELDSEPKMEFDSEYDSEPEMESDSEYDSEPEMESDSEYDSEP